VVLSFGGNDWGELGRAGGDGVGVVRMRRRCEGLKSGVRHVVVRMEGGVVVGWGAGRAGQLGLACKERVVDAPVHVVFPEEVEGMELKECEVGRDHSVFHFTNTVVGGGGGDRVVVMGSGKKGQQGGGEGSINGSTSYTILDPSKFGATSGTTTGIRIQASWSGTYVMMDQEDGSSLLWGFGSNSSSQLAHPPSLSYSSSPLLLSLPSLRSSISSTSSHDTSHTSQLASGSEHLLLLTPSCEVYAWGWNEHGNLGNGSLIDVEVPIKIWGGREGEGKVGRVWAGNATSWIWVDE
jgi:protein ATS1